MPISLTLETQRLIEERMKQEGFTTPDDLVVLALKTQEQVRGVDYEDLDEETRAAIEEGQAEIERGEGIPLEEAKRILRARFIDRR